MIIYSEVERTRKRIAMKYFKALLHASTGISEERHEPSNQEHPDHNS
jgi:hypothetical protein